MSPINHKRHLDSYQSDIDNDSWGTEDDLQNVVSIAYELLAERNALAKELFDQHQAGRKWFRISPCFCDRCQAYQVRQGWVAIPPDAPVEWGLVTME